MFSLANINIYVILLLKRKEIYKEVEAMQAIVTLATMNQQVLMADVLAKKKRITTRIDSTPEGHRTLREAAKCNAEGLVGQEVIARLQASHRLTEVNEALDNELQTYQTGWNKFPIAATERINMLHRYLDNKINYYMETTIMLANTEVQQEAYVYEIIIEELKELQYTIFSSM